MNLSNGPSSRSCAMLERRVHQHRMAQQHYHTQRKRARAEYHVPNQLKTERDRREVGVLLHSVLLPVGVKRSVIYLSVYESSFARVSLKTRHIAADDVRRIHRMALVLPTISSRQGSSRRWAFHRCLGATVESYLSYIIPFDCFARLSIVDGVLQNYVWAVIEYLPVKSTTIWGLFKLFDFLNCLVWHWHTNCVDVR